MTENSKTSPIVTSETPVTPAASTTPATQTTSATPIVETEFLRGTETAEKDALYSDFFQTNENGEISRKQEQKRSYLELFTTIMSFVAPIVVVVAIAGWAHAYIRGQKDNAFAENYPFLCGYLNYDIQAPDADKWCKTAKIIENEFNAKTTALEKNIVTQLAVYIPIKVASSASAASKEKSFIEETFKNKVNYNEVMTQFEKVRSESQSVRGNNIICTGATISAGNTLVTQCDIYGGAIGDSDTDARVIGSSRIETTRFIERLSRTQESHFILENPPTTLAITTLENNKEIPDIFKTKTSLTLSLRYIPIQSQL